MVRDYRRGLQCELARSGRRGLLALAALGAALLLAACGPGRPVRHGHHQSAPQVDARIVRRNRSYLDALRGGRERHDRAFFVARVAQARRLEQHAEASERASHDALAEREYERSLLMLADARHFALMTFSTPHAVATATAQPLAQTHRRLDRLRRTIAIYNQRHPSLPRRTAKRAPSKRHHRFLGIFF